MISIFYTGDRRHNAKIAQINHAKFLEMVGSIAPYSVHWFTKDLTQRDLCPWEDHTDDVKLRRGQGGAVQVWDFYNAASKVPDDIVIRMRTDVWFGLDSLKYVCQAIERMINDQTKHDGIGNRHVWEARHSLVPLFSPNSYDYGNNSILTFNILF